MTTTDLWYMNAMPSLDLHGPRAAGGPAALEAAARERLPKEVYEYYVGGAGEGRTLRENRAAFARVRLRPRVLVDVSRRELAIDTIGQRLSMPVALAPTALQGLAHPDGEIATARAATAVGTAMCLSTIATTSIEQVAATGVRPLWFQTYVLRDRGLTRALVERAEAAGVSALVVTVDAPITGRRQGGEVNRFALPSGTRIANLDGLVAERDLGNAARGARLSAWFARLIDPSFGWVDLDWLRSLSGLPLVLKGVLTAEDARLAREHGVDAVVVSNHGGRVLDGARATLEALPEVVDASRGETEVWMDGGIRTGSDVLKALGLGARLVLIGRPVLWALAVAGEAGVVDLLTSLRDELDAGLALCGCRSPGEVTRDHVLPASG